MKTHIRKGKYKHYKGNFYEVLSIAYHSETEEKMVVYRALYDSEKYEENAIWVRPLKMFLEDVELDGVKVLRFKLVSNIT